MNGLGILLLLYLGSKASKPARQPFTGKSGRTWFVTDRVSSNANTPVRAVFVTATGNDMVLEFGLMPGGVRASTFEAPSTLTAIAKTDFDVRAKSGIKL